MKKQIYNKGVKSVNWLAHFVNKHRKSIITVFMLTSVVGIVLFFLTPVNYNMMDYLPEQANSTQALTVMQEEFDQPLPNLNVMVENVGIAEALKAKTAIAAADHVKEVLWLDDTIDLDIPLEIQDTSTVETYYKDNNAFYMVSVEDGQERAAIAAVRKALSDMGVECKISGSAADQATSQDLAVNEAMKAIVLILPVTILILILVTESWIEPFFYLMNIGTPVIINLGTNIFMGEISFVTLAAAPVLQIAVSLDYAVFLSHSFDDYKKSGLEPAEAMRRAMISSISSIGASMLTTLFGFVALLFMKFRIGSDMGISLVKGILISFACVMIFFPAVLLAGSKLIDKTHHRRLFPEFKGIGKGIEKIRIPVVTVLLLVMLPAFLGQMNNEYFYGSSEKTAEGSEAWDIEQEFGISNSTVLMVPRGSSSREAALCAELKDVKHVTAVTSYVTMVSNKIPVAYLDTSITSQFYSDNYARIIISADCPFEGKEAFTMVEDVEALAEKYYPDSYYLCGQSANMYDMKNCVQQDNKTVTLITVISIYLILFIMTGNWLTPILLILTIECSIWLNMCIPYFMGRKLSYLGYLIVSTVQMGATIDYTNQPSVMLYQDQKLVETRQGDKVFTFQVPISGNHDIEVHAGELSDRIAINKVDQPNPAYSMDNRKNVDNWFDGELDPSCWSIKDNMGAAMADPKVGPMLKQMTSKAAASRGDVAKAVKGNPALKAMMARAMKRMTVEAILMQAGADAESIKQLNRILQTIKKEQ